jgi:hypothetical protein
MLSFLFGEGTEAPTAEALARKRAIINQLMARQGQPDTFYEGIRDFGGALAGRFGDKRLQPKEDAERDRAISEIDRIAALIGGGMPAPMPGLGNFGNAATLPADAPRGQTFTPPEVSTQPIPATGGVGPAGMPVPGAPAPLPPQIGAAVDRVAPPQLTEASVSSMNAPFPASLVETESGGNWNALNNVQGAGGHAGHGGRLQFGTARLQEAAAAGVVPQMTAQEFAQQPPEVQMAVENWHFQDIDQFIRGNGYDQLIGQEINGQPITLDGMRAVAHLGGKQGLARFIETRGGYNPADAFGTSLMDYFGRHGGGQPVGGGGLSEASMSTMGGGGGGNMAIVMQLAELMQNPYLPDGQRMVAQALIQQQMGTMFAPPMSELERIQLAQAQLDYEQDLNPPADFPSSVQEYQFYADQEAQAGRTPLSYAEWSVLDEKAANPSNGQYTQPTTPAQEAVDKAFATTYVEWTQGGGADAASQLAKIEAVAEQLESSNSLTGSVVGSLPDAVNTVINPDAVNARETVEDVVQRNLRLLLGAQFTQAEGERLIARAYNPRLPEAQNAARLRVLAATMRAALQAKQEQVAYYEQNGTLTGWTGYIPTVDDMIAAMDSGEAGGETGGGGNTVLRFNPETGDFEEVAQ